MVAPRPSSTTAQPQPAVNAPSTSDVDASLALELEKRKRRAERFGIPLGDNAKALERAKRFGMTNTTDESKNQARGRRFGSQVWNKNVQNGKSGGQTAAKPAVKRIVDDPAEAEKARKRAERFGGGNEAKKVKT